MRDRATAAERWVEKEGGGGGEGGVEKGGLGLQSRSTGHTAASFKTDRQTDTPSDRKLLTHSYFVCFL